MTVDGHSVVPGSYSDGRIRLELTPGQHEIHLDYGTDWRTIIGGVVTVITMFFALRLLWRTRRQKNSEVMPA